MRWESKESVSNVMNFDQYLMSEAAQFVNTVKLSVFFLRLSISLHVKETYRDERIYASLSFHSSYENEKVAYLRRTMSMISIPKYMCLRIKLRSVSEWSRMQTSCSNLEAIRTLQIGCHGNLVSNDFDCDSKKASICLTD